MDVYPTIKILPGEDRRLRAGSPWLFSNELRMDEAAKAFPPGSLVRLMAPSGKMLGVAQFNPHSLIAARLLTRNKDARDRPRLRRAPRSPARSSSASACSPTPTTGWSTPRPTACRAWSSTASATRSWSRLNTAGMDALRADDRGRPGRGRGARA